MRFHHISRGRVKKTVSRGKVFTVPCTLLKHPNEVVERMYFTKGYLLMFSVQCYKFRDPITHFTWL